MDTIALLEQAIDVIQSGNNESGYCECGVRVVMHRGHDHMPVDAGDKYAEHTVQKLKEKIAELRT